jgi:hypothetical protein
MRTRGLRRWVAGLCAAAALGIGVTATTLRFVTTDDNTWTLSGPHATLSSR